MNNYAVIVILHTPKGIPLVRDPHKPLPHFWKFPGGRSNIGELPEQAAARELFEETTIQVAPNSLKLIHREQRTGGGGHEFCAFVAHTSELPLLPSNASTGEEIRLFSVEQVKAMTDLFPNHRALITKFPESLD